MGTASLALGRYALREEIAKGGMATVHLGRMQGPGGFARTVAIKRLHPHLAKEPEFVSMLLDEARLTGRVRHPNVVSVLDVMCTDDEVLLVMDYVHGESLSKLMGAAKRSGEPPAPEIVAAIMVGALHGLHAAHTAVSEQGEPLGIVHRDFTPQNIMVGADGVPRVVDFGVARARGRLQSTVDGQVKGKPAYMAPEQVTAGPIDARTDVFAAGVVLWEALTLRRLFSGDNEAASMYKVLHGHVDPPSRVVSWVPAAFDKIVQRALRRDPAERFPSAKHMADAIEAAVPFASPSKVQAWVEHCAASALAVRAEKVASAETPAETAPAQARTTIINNNSESTPSAVNAAVSRGSKAKTVLGFGSAVLAAGALGAVAMNAAGSPERMPQLAVSPLKAMRFPQMAVPPAASSSGGVEALPKPLSRAKPQPPRAPVKAKVRVKPDNCDPPFVVDARGVRTFKRECL